MCLPFLKKPILERDPPLPPPINLDHAIDRAQGLLVLDDLRTSSHDRVIARDRDLADTFAKRIALSLSDRLVPYRDDPRKTLDDLEKELDDEGLDEYLDEYDYTRRTESGGREYHEPELTRTGVRNARLADADRAVRRRDGELAVAYDLYVMLVLLQERAKNNFPLYEGILLVKELKKTDALE